MGVLALTRKIGQSINIGDDVVITVERIKGNFARLVISAPDEVFILRTELVKQTDHRDDLFTNAND
jgi:carbon storage regulator